MRVIYIGNHHQANSNDDEGAVAHALEELGHEVTRVRETSSHTAYKLQGDLCLFHHWRDVVSLQRIECPRVCWVFDLVSYPDPTLEGRNRARRQWMVDVVPHVNVGFATDGDWVAASTTGKLVWLPQGADGRIVGRGAKGAATYPILFTGIKRGGIDRESFVRDMVNHYNGDFHHVERGLYRRDLADIIASSDVVVAPDAPVTDRYCSNRVFVALGFGAFLLHPRCAFLRQCYASGREIVFYESRPQLHDLIRHYQCRPKERAEIAEEGLRRTVAEHLYRHRVEQLLAVVKERGLV